MMKACGHQQEWNNVTGFFIAEMAGSEFNIVTYNLRGLNNGYSGLQDLCNNPKTLLIAIQEH